MKLLIVGGVAGGATAAARARRLSETAEITVLERGPYVSYANCGLPYFVSRDIEKRSKLLLQTPEGFESRYGVKVLVETEALEIDRAGKRVRARGPAGESWIPYDSLILAQGGTPVMPAVPGIDAPHVFRMWTVPDMDRIHAQIEAAKPATAVIAGGGFIGLEMAEAFVQRGIATTVVELLPRVMSAMDPEFGGLIAARLEAHGVRVVTGTGVKAVHAGSREVELGDGARIPADIVLFSVGVRPELGLARQAGLAIGSAGGLQVDEHLRTSDPHIWAAGDMNEIVHKVSGRTVRIPLAGPANRQGQDRGLQRARHGDALRGRPRLERREGVRRDRRVDRPHGEGRAGGGVRRGRGDRREGPPRGVLPRGEGAGPEDRLRPEGRPAPRGAGLRRGGGREAHRRGRRGPAGTPHAPRPGRGGPRVRASLRLGERSR